MDQTVHTGNDLSEGAEGHQLDDAHVGNVADLVGVHEHVPGVLGAILDAEGNLALLGIEGDDVHVEVIADGNDLGGVLDAAPAQLGDVNHAVHAADVDEHAVRGHGLHDTVVVLADLDAFPNGGLSSLTLLVEHGLDGTDHAAAGAVDLGDAELDLLLDHLAKVGILGQTALGSGHEDAHALDRDDNAALVHFGHGAFENGLVLNGGLNVFPKLDSVETLLGKGGIAFHVVDADNISFDLVADLDDVLGLHVGVAAQLRNRDVACLLAADVDLDLGRADRGHDAGHLISCIKSLERLFKQFFKGFAGFRGSGVDVFFRHCC